MTSPRDPGKIAGAFPSRAKGIMNNLLGFHDQVMAASNPGSMEYQGERFDPAQRKTFADNPLSEAVMRAEASVGRTSRRSPSRPSAQRRSDLTGVRERNDRQGWSDPATAMPHLCFPPDQYPQGVGPGSRWTCRCDAVWRSDGIAWDEYPTEPSRNTTPLKPERWFYVEGGQLAAKDYRAQEGLYDWRPLGPYYVKLYRAMIDNQLLGLGMVGKTPTTWEELG